MELPWPVNPPFNPATLVNLSAEAARATFPGLPVQGNIAWLTAIDTVCQLAYFEGGDTINLYVPAFTAYPRCTGFTGVATRTAGASRLSGVIVITAVYTARAM
jgi:hypothetical protein